MPLNSLLGKYGFPTTPTRPTTTMPRITSSTYDTSGPTGAGPSGMIGQPGGVTRRPTSGPTTNPYLSAVATGSRSVGQPPATPGISASQSALSSIGNAVASAAPVMGTSANNGTEPMSGWAKGMGYTPADLMGMNQMPARYLYDILKGRGQDPTGGLFYMMEPLADAMMPLFETIYGGGRDITKGFESNEIANFMGQMFGEMMTPGGRAPDTSELFGKLLNPGSDNSILNSYLNTGTPEEQVQAFQQYAQMIGQMSGSPMYRQALSNRLSERGYDYLNSFQGGQQPTNTFGQLVQNPNY